MERDLGARTVRAMQSACKELSETFRYNSSDLAILGLDPAAYVRSWIHEHFGHSYWRLDKMPQAPQRWKLISISHKTDPLHPWTHTILSL